MGLAASLCIVLVLKLHKIEANMMLTGTWAQIPECIETLWGQGYMTRSQGFPKLTKSCIAISPRYYWLVVTLKAKNWLLNPAGTSRGYIQQQMANLAHVWGTPDTHHIRYTQSYMYICITCLSWSLLSPQCFVWTLKIKQALQSRGGGVPAARLPAWGMERVYQIEIVMDTSTWYFL